MLEMTAEWGERGRDDWRRVKIEILNCDDEMVVCIVFENLHFDIDSILALAWILWKPVETLSDPDESNSPHTMHNGHMLSLINVTKTLDNFKMRSTLNC